MPRRSSPKAQSKAKSTRPPRSMQIHCTPGVDTAAAAADLLRDGAVGIDDITENLYDLDQLEIFDEIGHAVDEMDIREQRIETRAGPVFVLRVASLWTAAQAKAAVLTGLRAEHDG